MLAFNKIFYEFKVQDEPCNAVVRMQYFCECHVSHTYLMKMNEFSVVLNKSALPLTYWCVTCFTVCGRRHVCWRNWCNAIMEEFFVPTDDESSFYCIMPWFASTLHDIPFKLLLLANPFSPVISVLVPTQR